MTLVVKLGSSVVATDRGALRRDVLASVCRQVGALAHQGESIVLVTSGAIARGMWLLKREVRPKAMDELQAASAIGQSDLFRAYEGRLKRHGVTAAQVLLTRSDIGIQENYRNARQTIQRLLHWGMVPIVNENDTTATEEITFGDNDFLAAQIAVFLHARTLVLLTNTDGLYRSDPRVNPKSQLVKEVRNFEQFRRIELGHRPSHLGRGGMTSKIAAAEMASTSGVRVVICNGRSKDAVVQVAEGRRVGTRFTAAKKNRKAPARKLWLKYGSDPAGIIYVDDGAAERLRMSGSSLLAVGIVGLAGRFEAGDVVEVWDARDGKVGRGITEFSSRDLKRIQGRKSHRVREQFPDAPDEVIHRDRFVLV
ncbi:MAG TPA: glutamate 5-kinase [Solirubrobacterales bacterium]|nr:glutamate 5-kinase [Solirubrobacterales bacterium]